MQQSAARVELPIKAISIKPGIAYRSILYDYSRNAEEATGFLVGKNKLETYGLSMRVDYNPFKAIRLAGGVRFDKTTYPEKWFMSYQIAPTYKINDKHLLRGVISRAYRSTFVLDAHMKSEFGYEDPFSQMRFVYASSGNRDLQPIHSDMIEIGYRVMVADNLQVDLEAYHTKTEDFVGIVTMKSTVEPGSPYTTITTPSALKELEVTAIQKGITLSVNYVASKFQIKPFVTMQKTTLLDYSPWTYMPDADPDFYMNDDPSTKNIYSGAGTEIDHESTPKFYGGGFFNYQVNNKLNINVNSYWYSKNTFYHSDNLNPAYKAINPEIGVGRVEEKVLVNANIQYSPIKQVTLSLTGKNLFNNDSREFYLGDQMERRILLGVSFKY